MTPTVRERWRRRLIGALLAAALGWAPALAMAAQRTITLVNSCPVTVYPGSTTGAVLCGTPPDTYACPCSSNSCPEGQVCDKANNECYWKQPETAQGVALDGLHLQLAPKASIDVTVPLTSTTPGATVWSGGIWAGTDVIGSPARTLTSYNPATDAGTGYCAASVDGKWLVQPCTAYTGPAGAPNTVAEFTLVNSYHKAGSLAGADFYDITAINGVSVPMTMTPVVNQTFEPDPSTEPNSQYYWCHAPGNVPGAKPSAPCNWSFASQDHGVGMGLVQHQQNVSKRKLCGATNESCPTGEICGIAYDSSAGTQGLWQECGTTGSNSISAAAGVWSGSWTAVQVCTAINFDWTPYKTGGAAAGHVSSQLISAVPCGTTGPDSANAQLLQCKKPTTSGSCYTAGAQNTCCGCPSWPASYLPTSSCQNTNPSWTSVAYPWLSYVKQACPGAYSFQYDDPTSTFTCSTKITTTNTINTANYTITFCPADKLATP